jgi:hypothetical protein
MTGRDVLVELRVSPQRCRELARLAKLEAEDRRRGLPREVALGFMTMSEADEAIQRMDDIADILDWLADREIEIAEDGEPGW